MVYGSTTTSLNREPARAWLVLDSDSFPITLAEVMALGEGEWQGCMSVQGVREPVGLNDRRCVDMELRHSHATLCIQRAGEGLPGLLRRYAALSWHKARASA